MARYDPDFDISIETRWWDLMTRALNDKLLCIALEKHMNGNHNGNLTILTVKISPIDTKPRVFFSAHDLESSTELFFKAEKFVKDYEGHEKFIEKRELERRKKELEQK